MPEPDLRTYRYRGARALVILHDRAIRELVPVWRRARAAGIRLPETQDPDYVSLAAPACPPCRARHPIRHRFSSRS